MIDPAGTEAMPTTASAAPPPAAFHHVDASLGVQFVDRSLATLRRIETFTIEAQVPARFFARTYSWPGLEKDPVVESVGSGVGTRHKLHGPVIREGQSRTFVIDLGRELGASEQEKVAFTQTLIDLEGAFNNTIGARVHHPMRSLALQVTLPSEMVSSVRGKQSPIGGDKILSRRQIDPSSSPPKGTPDGFVSFEWVVPHPVVGTQYNLNWN